ncbi:MAG: polymer-forming cytoskeletal protein [Suilimivivens sp.]
MGFFSDLKDDLSQAVNELMPEEEMKAEETLEEALPETDDETASETVNGFDADLGAMLDKVEAMETPEESIYVAPAAAETGTSQTSASVSGKRVVDEVAVLTDSMIVNGNIATEGALDVRGSIVGNVEALGKLNITGAIQGNSQAAEIYAEGARITGELRSAGSVKIGQSTVIIGNIYANSAVIAGAVKGDIDVKGPVILDSSAIVMGNIKSKAVQINNGAVIEGMCSQCYAEVNPTSFFEELKKMK